MTFHEPNPRVRPTGEEPGEYADDGPLTSDPAAGTDPTRRPTGSPPLAPDADATDASRDPDEAEEPSADD
jgi:hypothetical protein